MKREWSNEVAELNLNHSDVNPSCSADLGGFVTTTKRSWCISQPKLRSTTQQRAKNSNCWLGRSI